MTSDKKEAIQKYQQKVASKSDLERTELNKEKTGLWTGTYAHHPLTNEEIPIWVSDYVLMDYGSGAVMGVPAHDERDFEFASSYKLPITCVFEPDLSSHEDFDNLSKEEFCKEIIQGKRCSGIWSFNQ